MRFPLVERTARGNLRVGSLYLLSALLVLLGGYFTLHDWHGNPLTVAMRDVFGSQLAYEAALVLAIGFLHRVRGEVRDPVVLLGILAVFLLDGLLVQHLYGWERGEGLLASAIGAGSAAVSLTLVAAILRVSPLNRLFATLLAAVLFARFAPALLVAAPRPGEVVPRFVALGWLLAAVPLGVWLPSLARERSRLPWPAMQRIGALLAFGLAALHFVNAGSSFDLPFRGIYLAPFVVVLSPALEKLLPTATQHRAARWVLGALPFVGLTLAASEFPPGLIGRHWAQAWPLTPFYLVLLLTAAVQLLRSIRRDDPGRRHVAAFLLLLACLGGDFPEILSAARFPAWWQALAVSAIAWGTIAWTRSPRAGTWLQAASGFVVASFVAERGYPWVVAFLLALAWGALALEALTGWLLAPAVRLALGALVTVLPVLALLAEPGSRLRLLVALLHCAAAFAIGWQRRDRLLRQLAPIALVVGAVGFPLAAGGAGAAAPGRLLTEAGFALLVLGVLHSVYGGRLRNEWRIWWQEGTRPAPAAAPRPLGRVGVEP